MKMQWGAALMAAAMIFVTAPQADADEAIPETVYQWVQSTSRQNYYFNKQQMRHAAPPDNRFTGRIIIRIIV